MDHLTSIMPSFAIQPFLPDSPQWETEHYQLLLVPDKRIQLNVNGTCGEKLTNELVLVPPHHKISINGDYKHIRGIFFGSKYLDMYFDSNLQCMTRLPLDSSICTYFDMIWRSLQGEKTFAKVLQLSAILFMLVTKLIFPLRNHSDQPAAESSLKGNFGEGRFIIYAARYIRNNLSNPDLSLKDISDSISYHPNYFCTVFKNVMGLAPMKYVNHLRLMTALNLLVITDDPVKSICQKVGIRTASVLNSLVKKHVGVTPSQFRRNHKCKQIMSCEVNK